MDKNQQKARLALCQLKEAVLSVLIDAYKQDNGCLQPAEMRKRVGIPAVRYEDPSNALILGVLNHLRHETRVQHLPNQGWELTEQEAFLWKAS